MITFGVEPEPSNIPNPSSEKQSWNKFLISSAVFAALIVSPIIFALPALLNGRTLLPPGDMGGLFDVHILIGKILSNGQLPLWNSYAQAGMPLIAAAYTGALNPLNWIFVFFSPVAAVNILAVITNQLAMVGCYLFARRINMSRTGCRYCRHPVCIGSPKRPAGCLHRRQRYCCDGCLDAMGNVGSGEFVSKGRVEMGGARGRFSGAPNFCRRHSNKFLYFPSQHSVHMLLTYSS